MLVRRLAMKGLAFARARRRIRATDVAGAILFVFAAGCWTLTADLSDVSAGDARPTTDAGPVVDAKPEEGARPHEYEAVVKADAPIAYYRLGEPTSDTIVRSAVPPFFEGTVGGGATLGASAVIADSADKAVHLDTKGSIALGVDTFTGVGSFTLEAWFSVESTDALYRMLLNKEFDSADAQVDLANVYVQNGLVVFERYVGKEGTGISAPITLNTPHHVVASYDGESLALYLDGALVGRRAQAKQPAPIARPLFLGNPTTAAGGFQGVVDEVAIYAVALPEARVQAHFAAGRR